MGGLFNFVSLRGCCIIGNGWEFGDNKVISPTKWDIFSIPESWTSGESDEMKKSQTKGGAGQGPDFGGGGGEDAEEKMVR